MTNENKKVSAISSPFCDDHVIFVPPSVMQ